MGKQISEHVAWVGKIDWQLTTFHGDELSTNRGSSYNSYLIRDEKTVLIDTVWQPYDKEFVARLKNEIDLHEIDYIVMNHNEVDHSGALEELLREIPGTPVYCTVAGEKILRGHYHHDDWNYVTVKTGDTLNIGKGTLTFVQAPFLHWPDTMFTYYDTDEILFSNDAFGQHYATESLFNDKNKTEEIYEEAVKYYANIVAPYSTFVTKKVNEVLAMNLPLQMIAPSHGVIWRNNPGQIVETYLKWADNYQEDQITIIYDTMWNSTRRMAEEIALGIEDFSKDTKVILLNSAKEDKSDILTEVFKSKAVLVGSPTYNHGYLYSTAGMLEIIKGSDFKNKKAGAFGSYGWSGEAVKKISEELKTCGFEVVTDGMKTLWVPDESELAKARAFGREFAEKVSA